MQFVGSDDATTFEGREPTGGISNYFIGNNPDEWRTDIPHYRCVTYRNVYPGIDVVYYGAGRNLEYDFVVEPGADPSRIAITFSGAGEPVVTAGGDLSFPDIEQVFAMRAPVVYQEVDGEIVDVAARYRLSADGVVSLDLDSYDPTQILTVDPVLVYSTLIGGNGYDTAKTVAVDSSGNAYVAGGTFSADFPTTTGAFDRTMDYLDVFVAKLNAAGTDLMYSTFLGGSGIDGPLGIALDDAGQVHVTGRAAQNFPVTPGAVDAIPILVSDNAFVTKLSASGSTLLFSALMGGSSYDQGHGVALDPAGNVYVSGETWSSDFPTSAGAFDTSYNGELDNFVAKLNPTGTSLIYSTFLGGTFSEGPSTGGNNDTRGAIAVDEFGSAYVSDSTSSPDFPTTMGAFDETFNDTLGLADGFIAKLNPSGTALVYSTFVGGSSNERARGLALDKEGNAYITGTTYSSDFPVTPGSYVTSKPSIYSAFVTKLNSDGTDLVYSTFLGRGLGKSITVDGQGQAHVFGDSASNFPTTPNALYPTAAGYDTFVAKLDADGESLLHSSYFGERYAHWIALGPNDDVYVVGETYSADFPTTPGAFDRGFNPVADGFIARLDLRPPPCVSAALAEAPGSPFVTGAIRPNDLVSADFNLDGMLDVAVANQSTNRVTIFLGDGQGGLVHWGNISVGHGPVGIETADFNLDGKPDLATVSPATTLRVRILLNQGDGTFNVLTGSPVVGPGPRDVVASDFNLDGKPDLATINYSSGDISVLLNDGAANFLTLPDRPFVGVTAQAIVAADFNLDGKPDLASGDPPNTMKVFLGDGTGAFVDTGQDLETGTFPFSIVAEDFNADGLPDLATANRYSNNVTVLLGTGAGLFSHVSSSPSVGRVPQAIEAADLNQDGKMDLIVGNWDDATLSILLGAGTGHFDVSQIPTGYGPLGIDVMDLNHDDKIDIVTANENSDDVTVHLNTCPFLVEKSSTPHPYVPGESFSYEINVNNVAQGLTLEDITLTDPIPSQVSVSSVLADGGVVCVTGSTVECELGVLAPGEGITVTVDGVAETWASGEFENVAIVAAEGGHSAKAKTFSTDVPLPDIAVASVNTTPTVLSAGTQIFTSYTIVNLGGATEATFQVRQFLSSDPDVTTSDIRIGGIATFQFPSDQPLSSGGGGPMPALPPGEYYVGVIVDTLNQVDESDETNNVRLADNGKILIGPPQPDLYIAEVMAGGTGVAGETVSVSTTVTNQGSAPTGAFEVGFYFAIDADIDAADIRSPTTCEFAGGLGTGVLDSTTCADVSVVVPTSVGGGSYTLHAKIDDLNTVVESNEANNLRAADSGLLGIEGVCLAHFVLSNETLSGTQALDATLAVTLGPDLVVDGDDVAVNAPTVSILGGTQIGGSFRIGTNPSCP